ncbi:MAG: RdgB/HAM1 family non-canonical purine NTP pyrophosphatase [Ignavibacteria bacterium]
MNKILIASNNTHKINEIRSVLKDITGIQLYSLNDFGITTEVIENGTTLEENAFKKAKEIYDILNIPSLSDDTGLFVDELEGAPGVYSARYAGEHVSYEDNCNKLLSELKNVPENKKTASFRSVICYYKDPGEFRFFKGLCKGRIISKPRGHNGFGYDPVFIPEGMSKTFAELTDEAKNSISHRAIALKEFRKFSDSYF